MANRKASGEVPEASKDLLVRKYGDWIPAQLRMGTNPHVLVDQISNDTLERDVLIEKRDHNGKVISEDTVKLGKCRVTGEQLVEWFPKSAAEGEPEEGHDDPDKPDTLNDPKDS